MIALSSTNSVQTGSTLYLVLAGRYGAGKSGLATGAEMIGSLFAISAEEEKDGSACEVESDDVDIPFTDIGGAHSTISDWGEEQEEVEAELF